MVEITMSYYTERNGLRTPIEHTYEISYEMYAMIFDCCEKYFDNLACKYPEECPDGKGCCGLSYEKFNTALTFEIPRIFKDSRGCIGKPKKSLIYEEDDKYDQYALLDLIELIAHEIYDITDRHYHQYFRHYDISFGTTTLIRSKFRTEINDIFKKTGLLYKLNDDGTVERIVENTPLTSEIEETVKSIKEKGTRELIEEAITDYKMPKPNARRDAAEKIWDAFERLKTYYPDLDKKDSATKIVNDMAGDNGDFQKLFNAEFLALTKIGNDYRIRHHETNKIDIADDNYYDYFFNRCLSLIALAIKYL